MRAKQGEFGENMGTNIFPKQGFLQKTTIFDLAVFL